jgi:hypothetical protein
MKLPASRKASPDRSPDRRGERSENYNISGYAGWSNGKTFKPCLTRRRGERSENRIFRSASLMKNLSNFYLVPCASAHKNRVLALRRDRRAAA